MTQALGMVETIGLAISIEVADAMLKSSNVNIVNQERVDLALVTIVVKGDVSSVQSAVEIGTDVAKKANAFLSAKVIPHPDISTTQLISIVEKGSTPSNKKDEQTTNKSAKSNESDNKTNGSISNNGGKTKADLKSEKNQETKR